MTAKELKRLTRSDLLEMMIALTEENERLRQKLEQTTKQLEDKILEAEDSASLAEAALRLNGVFEAAQAACDQYLLNVLHRCQLMEEAAKAECDQLLAEAKRAAGEDAL